MMSVGTVNGKADLNVFVLLQFVLEDGELFRPRSRFYPDNHFPRMHSRPNSLDAQETHNSTSSLSYDPRSTIKGS